MYLLKIVFIFIEFQWGIINFSPNFSYQTKQQYNLF